METTEQEIRTLRKKAKTWLVDLTYYSARGKVNIGTSSRRLQSLFAPLCKPKILQEALSNPPTESFDIKETEAIKKSIMSRLTPNKISRLMLSYPDIPVTKARTRENPDSFTLGRLIIAWAVLTDQSPQDFVGKVFPNVSRACVKFHEATGCRGLSDDEYNRYPQESACFLSGILRALIQATPEENLTRFMHTGIKGLAIVIEMPGLEKEINKLLAQTSRLMTKDSAQKIEFALKVNSNVRERINIPELKALIQREEAKLGWANHSEKAAIETLENSLGPELQEAVEDNEEIVRSSIAEISRRGLFNNLLDALSGQLRSRFIASIKRFLKSIVHVESTWEFDNSQVSQEELSSIRKWLFRR